MKITGLPVPLTWTLNDVGVNAGWAAAAAAGGGDVAAV
jgi:hypothetical protein